MQERIAEAKLDKDKAERDKDKAERALDKATSELEALKAANASADDIRRARDDVARIDKRLTAAMELYKSAIDAASRAQGGAGARSLPFSFKRGVKELFSRPLDQWQAGETFDVAGFGAALNATQFHDVLFLRAQGLDVLRLWEAGKPHLVIDGSPGMGKSTLLQFAVLRALVRGDPVLYVTSRKFMLLRMLDENMSVEVLPSELVLGRDGRPSFAETVVCYDSPAGFFDTMGNAAAYKQTFVVHSPSAKITNSRKAGGFPLLYEPPSLGELVTIGAIHNIGEVEVSRRVAMFGPSIRFMLNHDNALVEVNDGIDAMVRRGTNRLVDFYEPPSEVHNVTLMLLKPDGIGIMHTFASDHIRDQVVQRVAKTDMADLLRLANTVDLHGSLRGQVFENRMLDTLDRAGAQIKFKTSAGDKLLKIGGNSVVLCVVDKALALPAGESALRHGVLYRPPRSSNASWDAVVVENDSIAYFLQLTVSKERKTPREGLDAGQALLESAGFKGEARLVFLVPPALFEQLKVPQSILNDDNTASATAAHWVQEKWQVAAVDNVDFWPR